jgi:hypothetical protein
MSMRSRRRNLVVWSSSTVPASRSGDRGCTRLARDGRIRWWLRTGALLTAIGVMRFAGILLARRRDVFLLTGALLTVIGITVGSMAIFFCGMLAWAIARPWHWDEEASR